MERNLKEKKKVGFLVAKKKEETWRKKQVTYKITLLFIISLREMLG